MQQRWFEIALAVPTALVDEAAALLDFAGFGGVELRERGETTDVVVVFDVTGGDDELQRRADSAREAVAIVGGTDARIVELDPKVWTENWKRHFARRTFAGRIEIRPPWESATIEDGLLSIVINPGMAFGTGLHETTAACLELLVEQVRPGMVVADVGCGSGILAIAAARLGAREVVATDVDPLAVDATKENIVANDVRDRVTVELEPGEIGIPEWEDERPGLSTARRSGVGAAQETGAETRAETAAKAAAATTEGVSTGFSSHGKGAFDLLVANILAETLVEMRDMLTAAVRDGGTMILSGIEARRLKMVEEAFIRPPWFLARSVTKGAWVSICLHSVLADQAREPSVPGKAHPPGACSN